VSESVSTSEAQFWAASADGSKAVFTIGPNPESGDLYEFDVATKQPTLIAHGVNGVADVSSDASYIYFVSTEALAPGAVAGEANLYLYHEGMTFIATLSQSDGQATGNGNIPPSVDNVSPDRRLSLVSSDGRALAFLSSRSLTGYDNKDLNTGQADAELYRYDAGSGELACVSCNPSGARPVGRNIDKTSLEYFAAAELPGWENELYARRALTDGGNRLFFNSFDALLPQDTNGKADVYQWEADGTGDCEHAGGCLSLISTGQSGQDSKFLDASPSGANVFIGTESSLVPQDPGQVDAYDARINGGFPAPASPTSVCEGEACQTPPSPPVGYSPPGSSTFVGPDQKAARKRSRKRGHTCHHKKQRRRATHQRGHTCHHKKQRRRATHRNG
jgi:hypothetical protein